MENSRLGPADYVVFSVVLAVSALIGVYYRLTGGKQRTIQEYFMADKNMSLLPITCSLVASIANAVLLLGTPKETYLYGIQGVVFIVGALLGTFLINYFYLPVFFKLQATSAYEYLELRFGKITRLIASGLFIVERVLSMSIVLYAPAIALSAVTGISKWASILSVGFVCTFYSTIGGMKAVLWTDVFQLMLIYTTVFSVTIKGLIDASGSTQVWDIIVTSGRIELFNFDPDPTVRYTFWSQLVGGIFVYMALFGINQTQIQRLLIVKTLRKSQIAMIFLWVCFAVLYVVTHFAGIAIYSKYYDCDPVLSKRILSSDQLLPLFVMDYLAHIPGLAGLIVSGIFSASLSTISSTVNSLAAVTLEDFIRPALRKEWQSNKVLLMLTKTLTCAFGLLPMTLTFIVDQFGGVVQALNSMFGIFMGPLLGLFTLGMFCPRSTQRSALAAYVIGIVFNAWIGFGAGSVKPYVAELTRSIDGCSATLNTSLVTSLSYNNTPTEHSVLQTGSFTTAMPLNLTLNLEKPVALDSLQHNENIFYLYRISYTWLACIGCLTVVLFGTLVSLCEQKRSINPDLFSPVCVRWFPKLYNSDSKSEPCFLKTTPETVNEQTYSLAENTKSVSNFNHRDETKL